MRRNSNMTGGLVAIAALAAALACSEGGNDSNQEELSAGGAGNLPGAAGAGVLPDPMGSTPASPGVTGTGVSPSASSGGGVGSGGEVGGGGEVHSGLFTRTRSMRSRGIHPRPST
jgi:hypothetical protein